MTRSLVTWNGACGKRMEESFKVGDVLSWGETESPLSEKAPDLSRMGRWLILCVTALDHHKARVVMLVECSRETHLLVRNGALGHQKPVAQIREGMGIRS